MESAGSARSDSHVDLKEDADLSQKLVQLETGPKIGGINLQEIMLTWNGDFNDSRGE